MLILWGVTVTAIEMIILMDMRVDDGEMTSDRIEAEYNGPLGLSLTKYSHTSVR